MKRIMILDDELSITFSLSRCLKSESVQVISCNDSLSAKWALTRFDVDAILADVRLSAANPFEAIDFIRHVRARYGSLPLIMMSGNEDLKKDVMENGATHFLLKPVDLDHLSQLLHFYGLDVGQSGDSQRLKNLDYQSPVI